MTSELDFAHLNHRKDLRTDIFIRQVRGPKKASKRILQEVTELSADILPCLERFFLDLEVVARGSRHDLRHQAERSS